MCTKLPDGGHYNMFTGRHEGVQYTYLSKIQDFQLVHLYISNNVLQSINEK